MYSGNNGQGNNNFRNNDLLNRFTQYTNNNVPYGGNAMLANNPMYLNSLRDPRFSQKVNIAKIEQIRNAKSAKDLQMKNSELMEYTINPIKVVKTDKQEIVELYNTRMPQFIVNTNSKSFQKQVNDFLNELWKHRTNANYKGIINIDESWFENTANDKYKRFLKKENIKKEFKNKEDLTIHKVTKLEKNKALLKEEFDQLEILLRAYDKDLKVIYSSSEKGKYAKEFAYVNKYKYRIQYNPKNYDELKDIYKKEQKKLTKESRMIDNIIDNIMELDDVFDKKDISNFNKELEKLNKEIEKQSKKPKRITNKDRTHEILLKELGDDYEKILAELPSDSEDDEPKKKRHKKSKKEKEKTDSDNEKKDKKKKKKDDSDSEEKDKKKKKKDDSEEKDKKKKKDDSDNEKKEKKKIEKDSDTTKDKKKKKDDNDEDDELEKMRSKYNKTSTKNIDEQPVKRIKLKK